MADMPETRRWYKRSSTWRRIAADAGALAVGGNAAYLSWGHIVHTSMLLHQDSMASLLYPVSIDGMMIVGVVKATDDRATGRKTRPWARVATWLGGALSINAQVMSAWSYGLLAAAWSVVPAVTLIVVVEVQSRRGRLMPVIEPADMMEAAETSSTAVEPVAVVPDVAIVTPEPVPDVAVAVEIEAAEATPPAALPKSKRPPIRRTARRKQGYAGAGASDADVDAAIAALSARIAETDTQPVPVIE